MKEIYLSLGSNQGDRIENLRQAVQNIEKKIGQTVEQSSYYETEPWGFTDDTNFINQVIKIKSDLTPDTILEKSLEIEKILGRKRLESKQRYSSRNIDIDVLFIDDMVINTEKLTVPHAHIHKRNFVLQPMREIDSSFVHPTMQKKISQLTEECVDDMRVFRLENCK